MNQCASGLAAPTFCDSLKRFLNLPRLCVCVCGVYHHDAHLPVDSRRPPDHPHTRSSSKRAPLPRRCTWICVLSSNAPEFMPSHPSNCVMCMCRERSTLRPSLAPLSILLPVPRCISSCWRTTLVRPTTPFPSASTPASVGKTPARSSAHTHTPSLLAESRKYRMK